MGGSLDSIRVGGWFSQEVDCEFLPATPGSNTSHFSTDYADYRRLPQMKIGQGWRSKHSNPDEVRFRGLASAVICLNPRNLRLKNSPSAVFLRRLVSFVVQPKSVVQRANTASAIGSTAARRSFAARRKSVGSTPASRRDSASLSIMALSTGRSNSRWNWRP